MTLYYACVVLMFQNPAEKGPCVPISQAQSYDQCAAFLWNWASRAEAWANRSGLRDYRPVGMCLPEGESKEVSVNE